MARACEPDSGRALRRLVSDTPDGDHDEFSSHWVGEVGDGRAGGNNRIRVILLF